MKFSTATIGLGVSMTIGYGTLYYSFSVLGPEIAHEFGWGRSFVFAIFSFGLLAGAVAAPVLGRIVDRYGARIVLCVGSIVASGALLSFSLMQSFWHFAGVTLAAEFVALAVQYDAGFAALAQTHGRDARSHITIVTLIAGFASTVFWPLLQWLLTIMTWREVYIVLAAMNLLIAFPIHLALPRRHLVEKPLEPDVTGNHQALEGRSSRTRVMVLMAITFAAGGFVMSAIGSTLLVLMRDLGYGTAIATLAGSLIGPSQVAARLLEYARRNALSPNTTALISVLAMTLGLVCLSVSLIAPLAAFSVAFAIFYGIGQGLVSIVRGVLPLHYFGVEGYGRVMGTLSSVRMVFSAMAPVTVIWLNDVSGPAAAITSLIIASALSVLSMLWLVKKQ